MGLRPGDYIDVDWWRLLRLGPTIGGGFAGMLAGEAIEATYDACWAT